VIHPTHTAEAPEAGPTNNAKTGDVADATAKPAKSFAAVLADQKHWVRDPEPAKSLGVEQHWVHDAKAAKPHHGGHIEVPNGEMWRPVRGDDQYARITSGPRKGMYVNLSEGARRGEVFHVEHRHGKRVHVYGDGDHQKVVLAEKDSGKVHGRDHLRRGENVHTAHRGRNETWAPVPGHDDYVDILSGPRNGYYLNTSGGERDGMVFHIVHRHGQEYHIYGHGKNRQVVLVKHKHHHHDRADKVDKPDKATTTDDDASPASSETGGAAPS
jgi:hypothetical protein